MPAPSPSDTSGDETRTSPGHRSQPNYAARRMLVSTVAITVLVAGSVVAWRAVSGDGSNTPGATGSWTDIALVDTTTGIATLVDGDGESTGTTAQVGRVTGADGLGDRLALTGSTSITIVDLDDDEPTVVPIERGSTVTRLAVDEQLVYVVGDPQGGNLTIVDALTDDVYDVGAIAEQAAPRMFAETLRHDAAATTFAIADATTFQTIVVRRDDPTPGYYRDVPLAIDAETVATSQVVGQRSEIGLYDAAGDSLTIAPTEIPAGGLVDDRELTFVSVDGGVFRLGDGDDEPTSLGGATPPVGSTVSSVQPSLGHERLVLTGEVFQAVVDLDGNTVFTTTFAAPIDPITPQPWWSCLPAGSSDSAHSVISLDDGEQLADLTGMSVTGISHNGCSVLGERAGITELVTPDGRATLGQLRSAELGPDGRSVVVRTTAGSTELWTFDDDLERDATIDLSDIAPTAMAVVFVDR